MKSNELRIGNFVSIDDECCEVESINKNGINLFVDDLNEITEFAYFGDEEHHVKPIPLTEEWLLKFGFVKVKSSEDYEISIKLNHSDELNEREESVLYAHWDEDKEFYYIGLWTRNEPHEDGAWTTTKGRYVHHLQNLYFCLVGEELTIKD